MNQGIKLSFGEDEAVETMIPGREEAVCLSGKCQFAAMIDQPEGFTQLYCKCGDMPVFDIFRNERRCPKDNWFRTRQPEIDPVQITIAH
jgi:hypothetical protein